ncbi:MAG: chitobiase/beta-hexosaminidase C-terminal domain-containing protein [Clostridiales bacterium]|nr:chitobiase/beta-hexosaminidase C-terminal domain-containing protein [Clostridiales bacterium]
MKKATRFLVSLMLGLLIFASVFWYLFIYDRDFTRDTLLSQARFQALHGNSRLSSWFYDAAYNFSGHDENVAIELANQYKKVGNYTKAELTLTTSIHDQPTVELYTALSKVYVEQDKLLDAVQMLGSISNPAIAQEIDALRPTAPEADQEPGFFSQYIDVHLSSNADTVYYTTDGTYPSVEGSVYDGGISLPAGETKVCAIAVNKDGLVSPVTALDYTVTGVIEKVEFTDAAMEAAMRELIHVSSTSTVYTDALWGITEFTAPEDVKDFSDLKYLPNLTKLTIREQNIPTLESLSPLSRLVVLDLTGSTFPAEDLQVLASLPSLSSLTMAECSLSTIAGLENAANLTYLDLHDNTLRNLDVLETMPSLAELDLQHNAVTDLGKLSGLDKLVKLNIGFNAVTTLAPLSSCTRLTWLNADNNQITTLDGVDKLTALTDFSVNNNKIVGVSQLAGLTALQNLGIASNSVSDITMLNGLTKLQSFDFSGNNAISELPDWPDGCALTTIDGSYNTLTSIDSLRNMQNLTHVYMDYNQITNIDALQDCYCLVQVNVFGNAIADVSALRSKDIIVNYDPTAA